MTRVAVIGHVEWITHGRTREPLVAGNIHHLGEGFEEPGGGGGVSARALPSLGARTRFFTALGSDEAGERSGRLIAACGVEVLAGMRPGPQNRVLTVSEPGGERTIFVLGPNVHPRIDDPLPWDELAGEDAVFYTGDDPRTLQAARAARVLVVTARRLESLIASGVSADVLIGSAVDPSERIDVAALPVRPRVIAQTDGAAGGSYATADGRTGRWKAAPLPGPVVDAYGAGDVMMAALTLALGRGDALDDALAFAATAAAGQLTRPGGTPPGQEARPVSRR